MLMVALTLLRIFPRLIVISGTGAQWAKACSAMYHSKEIVDRSATPHHYVLKYPR